MGSFEQNTKKSFKLARKDIDRLRRQILELNIAQQKLAIAVDELSRKEVKVESKLSRHVNKTEKAASAAETVTTKGRYLHKHFFQSQLLCG